jgi:Bacterial conjugation TrbI-like protein
MENQQNTNTPQNDPQPKSEPSLQDLAEIIDLDFDPNDPVTSRHHTAPENSENPVIDVEAIEEEAVFHDEFDPEQNRTRVTIQKHPLAKSAVIVGGTLAIIGGSATFFLSQIPKDQVAAVPEKKEPVNEQVQSAQSAATKAQQSESEAKAELALSRQRDSLAQATSSPQPSSGQSSPAASPTATTPASPTTAATSPQPTRTVRTPVPPIVIQPVASTTPTRQRSAAPAAAPVVTAAAQPNYTARRAESNSGRQQVRTIATQPQTVATRVQSTATTPRIQRSVDRAVSAVEIGSRSTAPGVPRVSRTAAPSIPARIQQRTESETPAIARTRRRTESENPVIARNQRRTESENPVVASRTQGSATSENPVIADARLPIVPAPGVARTDTPSGDMAPPPTVEAPTAAGGGLVVATAPSIREYLSQAVDGPTTTAAVPVKTATTASAPVTTAAPITTASPAAIARANVVTTAPVAIASVSQPAAPATTQRVEQAAVRGRSRSAYETESAMNRTMARIVPAPGMTDVTSIADGGVAPPANIPTQEAAMEAASLPITVAIDDAPNGARTAYANTRLLMASAERASGALGADPVPVAPVSKASGKEQAVVETNPVLQIQSGSTGREPNYSFMASSLLIGTSAKTSTLTPVLWGGDGTASNAKFVLKLEEPLLASNRREAFPAGTQLIVVAKPASANVSIADVEVVSIVISGKEYAAPPGTLVIRDEQNGLLVGEDYYRRDEQIANRDTMTFVTGALSTVGQMMNRPTSTYSSTNTGNFGGTATNVVTNGAPNLLGAVLEGGFRDLPSMWSQRNQQALAELATKPRIYQIPKGRTVRVFVNQSIDF